ncbi:diguanylate cyclase [Aureimonas sp. AU12]|uniref:GGDEF domain-containing protein n=1 Tax=Aureimonas sp. AU12 TaxID=1638161 RepID=UPI00078177B4|nr:GGDEF domain-containing protein [Aureimonas sp. AU12]
MRIDVPTLYYLAIGTLSVAAAMTLWERRSFPARTRELDLWAASYSVLALGCLAMMNRTSLPAPFGAAVTNLVMVAGYWLQTLGIARLDGRERPGWAIGAIMMLAALWAVLGTWIPDILWLHVGAAAVALPCLFSAALLWSSPASASLRSCPVAIAIFAGHGLFYVARAVLLPFAVAAFGHDVLAVAAMATMFEGVLYSVAAPMVLMALVREEREGRLLELSQTDYLTGLANRRALFRKAERLLARGAPASLLVFDLDHFKTINDRYGHQTGDDVLKLFAAVAEAELRPVDVVARLGGEEFAALLPGIGRDEAKAVARRVSQRFSSAAGDSKGLNLAVTASVGVAESTTGTADLDTLLAAADRALYRAKHLGRNRVELEPVLIAKAA